MRSIFANLALCLLAVTLASGQGTTLLTSPNNSTLSANQNKPSAGIPLATTERKKDDSSDRQIAQHIRQSMAKDKSLSKYAHKLTITCRNGMVTLRGPVRSEDEKHNVEEKAADVVSSDHITSELAVTVEK
jgi:hyperosmotically inducible periplasmic protein